MLLNLIFYFRSGKIVPFFILEMCLFFLFRKCSLKYKIVHITNFGSPGYLLIGKFLRMNPVQI